VLGWLDQYGFELRSGSVSLMPNPMKESDHVDMVKRFTTLQAIIEEAERKTKGSD
jgi:hypothetical protein